MRRNFLKIKIFSSQTGFLLSDGNETPYGCKNYVYDQNFYGEARVVDGVG